jgi:putative ABC transport system substrate-binding protein
VSGKWIEVLNEIAPKLSRAMVIQRAGSPNRKLYFPRIEEVARERNMRLTMPELQSDAEIDRAIAEFAAEPAGGLIVLPGSFTTANRDSIISLAAGHRLPAVYPFRNFVEAGGLVSYGIDTFEVYRRSASYIDRILRGAKPADLPIQLPTKFELIVNLKTAKGLGLTIPTSLLTRADEVIE